MINKRKLFSFRRMTITMIGICWIVPIMIIFISMSVTYKNDMIEKTEDLMTEEVKTHSMTLSFHINEVINLTKDIFYERRLEKAWERMVWEGDDKDSSFYDVCKQIITEKFDNDWRVKEAFLFLLEDLDHIYPQTTGELAYYTEENKKEFLKVSNQDNAKPNILVMDKQIYVVRNIYSITGYHKYATLVIALDMDKLLKDMSKSDIYDLVFFIGENESLIKYDKENPDWEKKEKILNIMKERYELDRPGDMYSITARDKSYMGFVYKNGQEYYDLCSVLIVNRDHLLSGLKKLVFLIGILLLVIIPIIAFFIWYFRKNITSPVEELVGALKRVKDGQMGEQMETSPKTIPNEEFSYLIHSFNEMSSQIKYLFDYAYREEIARRDAQILALQSQINPHFLNNTLEMMNWQARMSGDIEVSKMIEALSTLMDHSMNRDKKKLISLSEEIRCGEAYFYILSMRFGQRIQIEKNIDETVLQVQVPQLILQPLLENAVTHGIEAARRGTIWLNVYKKERRLVLEVLNTGKNMTKEDEDRIRRLLEGETEIEKGKGEHTSLGIRNVNRRIKLIYGEGYGLSIKPYAEGITAAVIELPNEQQ